ncbi:MAG: NADP-dependent isocitrate dehydrogenase [Cytophagaceae bacterium]|nr:NADP-dependent isocitrate dehydrogenase [Cytophagaceae bacterium]
MQKITIAKGDGIGPEIMDATLAVLKAAGAALEIEEIEVGERVYLSGNTSGISQESMEVIRKNKIFLKAPITTPQGGGYKSLNVTIRKSFGLFANVRPAVSYHPFISSKHSNMDLVIIRENEEDLYAGIEHQQTDEVVQCLKLVSRPGCEKLIRYAFEFARQQGRKKVTCFTKDNIMKQTDGLFHKVFDEIGAEYEDIEKEHWIVDIGAAKMADTPEVFDVIVTLNLYGDILSDVAAQIAGSVGLAGSANIGEHCAMFEAIHGSAPRRAGQNLANPSGLLQGAVLMLQYIGQHEVAEKIQNAWLKTLEDGVLTYDVYREGMHTAKVGTKEFAEAIIARLGQVPSQLPPARFIPAPPIRLPEYQRKSPRKKVFKGFDLFLHWNKNSAEELANMVMECSTEKLALSMITNRGIKVWPNGLRETFCTDHWRCRFKPVNGVAESEDIVSVLKKAIDNHLDVIKTENLYAFDGVDAYSLGQGQ